MPAHSTLTGADLHEPKGADAASTDTVYVADGAGSGTWEKVTSDSIDTTSVKNVNKFYIYTNYDNLNTTNALLIPTPFNCTLTKVTGVLSAALGTANVTVNVYKKGGLSIGSFVFLFSGSAKGDTYTLNAASNNTFVSGDYIEISHTGAGTGSPDAGFLLEFTLT